MSKFIVFCADGTWNGPGQPDGSGEVNAITNVLKAYRWLDGTARPGSSDTALEQEKSLSDGAGGVAQVAKYIDGVGDSNNWFVHTIGGDFGAGMIARIVRGYTFISRHYEPGDKIVLLGFSRGAYTVRALGGLITGQGLLDRTKLDLGDRNRAYAWGCCAWRSHRAATCGDEGFLQKLAEAVPTLDAQLTQPPAADAYVRAPIEAIFVWDTVGALGIPDIQKGVNIDLFCFVDTRLAATVAHGFHAISADEQRPNFTPTLWDADDRIVQVIFPGAHADVGGGYPVANNESGLSDCALHWAVDKLQGVGVRFSAPDRDFRPDKAGVAHAPWRAFPWNQMDPQPRHLPAGLALSQSVLDRLALPVVFDYPGAPATLYNPAALGAYLAGRSIKSDVPIVLY